MTEADPQVIAMGSSCTETLLEWTFGNSEINTTINNDTGMDFENPDVEMCLQARILIWIPALYFWLACSLQVITNYLKPARYPILEKEYSPKKSGNIGHALPWTWLNITKMLATGFLVLLYCCVLTYKYVLEDYEMRVVHYGPKVRIITLVLVLLHISYCRRHGIRASGTQFIFWLLFTACDTFQFLTTVLKIPTIDFLFIAEVVSYLTTFLQFVLNFWADAGRVGKGHNQHICPEEFASFPSRLVFGWFAKLASKGFHQNLAFEDLWHLSNENHAKNLIESFDKHQSTTEKHSKRSILSTLIRMFGYEFIGGALLKLAQDLLIFVSPEILRLLVRYVLAGAEESSTWKGIYYAVLLAITSLLQAFFLAHYFQTMFVIGMRLRSTLVSLIYRKALVISNAARRESTVGEIVNLMSVDSQHIMDLIPYLNLLWSAPLQITFSMYFLWGTLGPSVLAGVLVIAFLIPINAFIGGSIKRLQTIQMNTKDKRVKLMAEILSGIKVLKFYSWESSFHKQICDIRQKEVDSLRPTAIMEATITFMWSAAPFLVAMFTFGTYILVDKTNALDAEKAFVSLTLFNILSTPLTMLPGVMSSFVQAQVSMKRLNKFMNSEEIDSDQVTHDAEEDDPIILEKAEFCWNEPTVTLKNINLRIKEGSLVAIVGPVGCGKSSLLYAILGELPKSYGRVNTKGSIAYVAQQAWMQGASLRDNVLFGRPLETKRYQQVIESCALLSDLAIFPSGDQTQIGERGLNLSGGQKQRVALARAAYSGADLYLLDDPLSAVDSHVGKHIFDKLIGPKGMLKGTTRVLVTHGVAHLSKMDQIIVMKDGEIAQAGTYAELMAQKGSFSDFLLEHIGLEEASDNDEQIVIRQDLEKMIGKRELIRRISQSSISEQSPMRIRSRSRNSVRPENIGRRSGKAFHTPIDNVNQVEKAETGSVNMSVYLHYCKAIGLGKVALLIIFQILAQAFAIGTNMWLAEWSNEPIVDGVQADSRRNLYLSIFSVLGISQSLCIMLSASVLSLGTLEATNFLHLTMLNRILRAPMFFFDMTPTGRIVNRFAKDVDTCDNVLPNDIRSFVGCLFKIFAIIIVISISTPIFILVTLPAGILYVFIQKYYVASSRQLKRLESVSRSPIYSHFSETIQGAATIRAFGMQEHFMTESEEKVDRNQRAYFPSTIANRWLGIRLEALGNTMIFFTALFGVLGRDGLSPGTIGLSISYALQVTAVLNWMVRMASAIETNTVAVERMKEYSEIPQEGNPDSEYPPESKWPQNGEIVFEGFQARYRPELDIVLRVTGKIGAGEKVGIVGRTGAGKSSITLGLFRIIEAAAGCIKIDGIDISKLDLQELRRRISIIPQDPVLFSGTLRMNLDPFLEYTDEELWKVLELTYLKHFVKELRGGLSYEVEEGGENISVGQRQQICIARALLRKTRILVLDEATASVDLETDQLIQETIKTQFTSATVLTIAHRLKTIMDSTRVIVLSMGEIREFDRPEFLLRDKESIFYSMAKDAGIV